MNILILTNLYPAPDLEKENTPVVHYFAREWVKMGCSVRVVHYPANFPKIMMWAASLCKTYLSSKIGSPVRTYQTKEKEYELDGVKVKRLPLLKYKLHGTFSKKEIYKAYRQTIDFLVKDAFRPDCIVSHWVNPQLEIMELLNTEYRVPTCYVAHTPIAEFIQTYDEVRAHQLIKNIDLIGFRSQYIKDVFLNKFGYKGPTFQCYSGIPEKYVPEKPIERSFDCVSRFVFVGTLIKRKYPAEIVPAVVKAFGLEQFEIYYIGQGAEEAHVLAYAKQYGIESSIHLLGRLSRDEVIHRLQDSDVFVMNSRSEAFGLVYLEAMAQGCITIASRHEGFDGIIQDGENGFLCNAGDIDDLSSTIRRIKSMKAKQLIAISNNAFETARRLTDKKAASMYLKELEKLTKNKQDE